MRLLQALAKGPERLKTAWRTFLWRRLLNAPVLSIQAGAQILGAQHICLGENFRAGRQLWLEAVTKYKIHGKIQEFSPKLSIGDRVSCSDTVHIACIESVTIGNDVLIGSKVHITDHNHGQYKGAGTHTDPQIPPALRPLKGSPVHIGDRVFLADGVVVLPGSSIGEGTVVGANSVVSGHLPPNSICVGTPASPVKSYDTVTKQWQAVRGKTAKQSDFQAAP